MGRLPVVGGRAMDKKYVVKIACRDTMEPIESLRPALRFRVTLGGGTHELEVLR